MESSIQNKLNFLQENKDVDFDQNMMDIVGRSICLLKISEETQDDEHLRTISWQVHENLKIVNELLQTSNTYRFLGKQLEGLNTESDPDALERDAEKMGECVAVFWSSGAVADEKFELGRCLITETVLEKQRQLRKLAKKLRA